MSDLTGHIAELKAAITGYDQATNKALAELRAEMKEARDAAERAEIKASRLRVGGEPSAVAEYDRKSLLEGFGGFGRTGREELKGLFVGSAPDGGFLVAPSMAQQIRERVAQVSPIRAIANPITLETGDSYEEPAFVHLPDASWVSETGSRPATAAGSLQKVSIPVHEIYACPPVSQKLLDTSAYDVGAALVRRIGTALGKKEGAAFVSGDGVGKPKGFLTYDTAATADASRAWGVLQYIPSGAATAITADSLIDTSEALAPEFRPNARWVLSRTTAASVRKLKDTSGRYLWQETIITGQPASLLGYPVTIADDMPAEAAGAYPIAFGDFQAGYGVVDSRTMTVLRDPFTAKPHVLFYSYARVGGGVLDFDAIKLVKCATS